MSGYDYDRPFLSEEAMQVYVATDRVTAERYGKTVRAAPLANIEYKIRFGRLKGDNNMKPPPSCGRIFPGYVVVRKLGTPAQYETWMPDHVFEEIYQAAPEGEGAGFCRLGSKSAPKTKAKNIAK